MSTTKSAVLAKDRTGLRERNQALLHARAVALSQPLASETRNAVKVLVFSVGNESFGLPASTIREIVRVKKFTRIPGTPGHVPGVVNLRGEIISVTDLATLVGLERDDGKNDGLLVVVDVNNVATAIQAKTIDGIIDISLEEIEPPLKTLDAAKLQFFKGLVKRDDKVFSVLHLDAILRGGES